MDIYRKVTLQGVWFCNNLYCSDALKALVGQRVPLVFDGVVIDQAKAIHGECVIDVRRSHRGNPGTVASPPVATDDSSAKWPHYTRASD